VLVNPTDYFLYLPLLPEVEAGILNLCTVAAQRLDHGAIRAYMAGGAPGVLGRTAARSAPSPRPAAWPAGGDQVGPGQVAAHRRGRDPDMAVVKQVPGDGVRPGVQAASGQLLAQPDDQLHRRIGDRRRGDFRAA
jgi:hypothetical protein